MAEFGKDLLNEGSTNQGSSSQEKQSPSPTGTQHNIRPNTLNTTGQDAYWFAHAADPPQDRVRHNHTLSSEQEDEVNQRLDAENSPNETDGNAANRIGPRNRNLVSPTQSECKDDSSPLSQKEREERFRLFKERQEGDRQKRLTDLQQQSIAAQRFREMQEDERRRRIDELRQKDLERRIAVEERKRQIWEAEQERKEAIVRRNLEREAKIEARRNAQRNSMSFAFGSSTPRVIDLDLGGFKISGPPFNCPSPALNGRRTPSAAGDQKTGEDLMSRSMVILPSGSRGRRKTDLTPTLPWERDISQRSHSPASSTGGMSASKRAVSMSRLDILAQPRRRYVVDHSPSNVASSVMGGSTSGSLSGNIGPRTTSSSMSKSMFNLAQTFRRGPAAGTRGLPRRGSGISSSMVSPLGRGPPNGFSPTSHSQHSPPPTNLGSANPASKRMSQSMTHLALVSRPPPRPTRASRMRATLAAAQQDCRSTSILALDQIRSSVSEMRKDSPSRPRSSMSGTSEQSMTSTVSMRSQSGPRRPRPVSMVGAIPDSSHPTPPQRLSRTAEKPGGPPPTRPPRAKSVGPDSLPPPKPPPRRSPTSKAASPKPANLPPSEKPIATVQPNPFEPVNLLVEVTNDAKNIEKSVVVQGGEVIDTSRVMDSHDLEANNKKEGSPPMKDSIETPQHVQSGKPRITSEEEAKAALAEKRRIAREQAEREAEMERQRQAEIKRLEEERLRQEEEEQRRFEEEQMHLAAELRKQEEEKLERAIREQEERENEERKRLEEEAKSRVEKEEQDRKARDEAEKQRKELEEKLKKEEEERAERKKRVEQIMKRTRAKNAASGDGDNPSEQSIVNSPVRPSIPPPAIPVNGQEEMHNSQESLDVGTRGIAKVFSDETKLVLDSEQEQKVLNGFQVPEAVKVFDSEVLMESEAPSAHTNGTSSPESVTQSPEVNKGEQRAGNLLDFDSMSEEPRSLPSPPSIEQLIDLNTASVASNQNEVQLMNASMDDLNSNRMLPNNPFIAFEDNVTKKQPESSFTDLLS